MKSFFDNAELGDAYQTRDHKKAVLWYMHCHNGIVDTATLVTTEARTIIVDKYGKDISVEDKTRDDIVGWWHANNKKDNTNENPQFSNFEQFCPYTDKRDREIWRAGFLTCKFGMHNNNNKD